MTLQLNVFPNAIFAASLRLPYLLDWPPTRNIYIYIFQKNETCQLIPNNKAVSPAPKIINTSLW